MWNLQDFESMYERYKSSGLCIKYFCRNEGIAENKFYYWRNKHKTLERKFAPPSDFVPIVFNSGGTPMGKANCSEKPSRANHLPSSDMMEIVYPNGIMVRIPATTEIKKLQSLILLSL